MVRVTVDLPELEDPQYKDIEEFRPPEAGEPYRSPSSLSRVRIPYDSCYVSQFILKKNPWRATEGGIYYYVDDQGNVARTWEDNISIDDLRWELGNYFKSEDQAYIARDKIWNIFRELKNN